MSRIHSNRWNRRLPGIRGRRMASGYRVALMTALPSAALFGLTLVLASTLAVGQERSSQPAKEPPSSSEPAKDASLIQSGSTVELQYTLADGTGAIISSNRGQAPLRYVHGRHEIPPGLEQALVGLKAGDRKTVTVAPEDGFGPIDPQAIAEVPRDSLPSDALVVGTTLIAKGPQGERPVRVKEVREKSVVLDLNHPLAGQTLHFDVQVLGVTGP
jgi:FKBP-type peptidyl-prolyl cis-trans isomerase SlyD